MLRSPIATFLQANATLRRRRVSAPGRYLCSISRTRRTTTPPLVNWSDTLLPLYRFELFFLSERLNYPGTSSWSTEYTQEVLSEVLSKLQEFMNKNPSYMLVQTQSFTNFRQGSSEWAGWQLHLIPLWVPWEPVCMFVKFHSTMNFKSKVSSDIFKNRTECQLKSTFSSKLSPQCHMPSSLCYCNF